MSFLRMRCAFVPSSSSVASSSTAVGCGMVRLQWHLTTSRRMVAVSPVASILPYGLTVPARLVPHYAGSSSSCMIDVTTPMSSAKRYFRARGAGAAPEEGQANQEAASKQQQEQAAGEQQQQSTTGEGEAGKEGEEGKKEKAKEEDKPQGLRDHIAAVKRDMVEFPDIYNSANALNFVLFTVFCLCSTGSNVEEAWWLDTFGIDAAFRPLAWLFHSAVMNNFLSMTFAMMLVHTMCHSVLPTIGSQGLFKYCAIISVVSGFVMWLGNFAAGYTKEKQFGPWDVVAGLFVMQFLHQGFKPWQIINSFNGWIRYACWVGAACILYYDWQPTLMGTIVGFALCKGHPKFRVSGPAAGAV